MFGKYEETEYVKSLESESKISKGEYHIIFQLAMTEVDGFMSTMMDI